MEAPNRPVLALLIRLAAAFGIATLYLVVKLAHESGIHIAEIMFWRQAGAIPPILLWLTARRRLSSLATGRLGTHALRAVAGTIGMLSNFGATILLPLAVATILGFTTPLFAVILTFVLLREKVGPWRMLAVALGFAGVLVIARPGAMPIAPLGAFAGLLSGFMVALISFQVRDLARTEAPLTVVFYFALFGTLFLAPLQPFVMSGHTPYQWLLIGLLGLIGTFGQILLTTSLRFGAVASVVVMDYSAIIWTTLFGWKVFNQLPPASTWLGAPLIIAAGLVIAWREHRLSIARSLVVGAEAG